jgi:hypothetical protein
MDWLTILEDSCEALYSQHLDRVFEARLAGFKLR